MISGPMKIKNEFKSNENIHKKEDGSYYVVLANKASSVTKHALDSFEEQVFIFITVTAAFSHVLLPLGVHKQYKPTFVLSLGTFSLSDSFSSTSSSAI